MSLAHAQQLWMHFLFGLLQYLDKVGRLFLVFLGEERVGNALVVSTACSADTVLVGLKREKKRLAQVSNESKESKAVKLLTGERSLPNS